MSKCEALFIIYETRVSVRQIAGITMDFGMGGMLPASTEYAMLRQSVVFVRRNLEWLEREETIFVILS